MLSRRVLLAFTPVVACTAGDDRSLARAYGMGEEASPAVAAWEVPLSFQRFLEEVRAEALRRGISPATLARAFADLRVNPRVLELDRRQPEVALSWEEYRDRIMVTPIRVRTGRRLYAENAALLQRIENRYRVASRIIVAIWGVETNFGTHIGGFRVIEALATLAWEGRRAAFFRNELFAALRILEEGHVDPERMIGSWAGAMGQPQFMPSNFVRLAVDFDGDGRRDIWHSRADALASIAHYLHRHGWRYNEPWGWEVHPPAGFDLVAAQGKRYTLKHFARWGFRTASGGPLPEGPEAEIILPHRGQGQVFLGHHNLSVIRRYNSPINYALAVGLLADRIVS